MDVAELVQRHPRLYHMAQAGSWGAIRDQGLLTTAQLVRTSSLPEDEAAALLVRRRSASVTIDHPRFGAVVIRDQGPLREQFLTSALTDMTVQQWLDQLNGRVFFWPREDKLLTLLKARRYRSSSHDVLTVDTASLVRAHGDRIRLCGINSGATLYPNATPRGSRTFLPIDQYDYEAARRRRGAREALVELAVLDGVPDIAVHVVRVERRQQDSVLQTLFDCDQALGDATRECLVEGLRPGTSGQGALRDAEERGWRRGPEGTHVHPGARGDG